MNAADLMQCFDGSLQLGTLNAVGSIRFVSCCLFLKDVQFLWKSVAQFLSCRYEPSYEDLSLFSVSSISSTHTGDLSTSQISPILPSKHTQPVSWNDLTVSLEALVHSHRLPQNPPSGFSWSFNTQSNASAHTTAAAPLPQQPLSRSFRGAVGSSSLRTPAGLTAAKQTANSPNSDASSSSGA